MRHDKLSPVASLGLEVDHQAALLVDPHTGGVHGSCESNSTVQHSSYPVFPFEVAAKYMYMLLTNSRQQGAALVRSRIV